MVMLLIKLYGNQIWCRDSFQEGIDVCQISLSCHCPASALTLCCKDGEGEIHSSSDIESQKTLANSSASGTII